MKLNKSAALLGFLVALLAFSPVAFAQTYTVTVSTDRPSYSGTQTVMVSGTVSPAPGPNQAVLIQLINPSGAKVPLGTATLTSTGSYTFSFVTGGTYMQQSGTYTVVVTFDGASGQATFQYTPAGAPSGAPSGPSLMLAVSASFSGTTLKVTAVAMWSNGTAASSATATATYYDPSGASHSFGSGAGSGGVFTWSQSLTSPANGPYVVSVTAAVGTTSTTSFATATYDNTVTNQLTALSNSISALQTAVGQLSSSLSSLSSAVSSMQGTLSSLASSAGSLSTSLTNIQNSLTSLGNTASSLSSQMNTISGKVDNAASQASSAASAVGTTQLYVLIVAVIAAITLVLELAILVRKLS